MSNRKGNDEGAYGDYQDQRTDQSAQNSTNSSYKNRDSTDTGWAPTREKNLQDSIDKAEADLARIDQDFETLFKKIN
jgi:hypothetical protein